MKLSQQASTVLQHLRTERYITSWAAEGVYRIRRLASRIDELVAAGYQIEKEMAEDRTGQRYTRYSLSAPQRRSRNPLNPQRVRSPRVRLADVERVLRENAYDCCLLDSEIKHLIKTIKETA